MAALGDDIRKVLVGLLSGNSTIVSLTGGRIRPGILAESDPKPALTYSVLSNVRDHTLSARAGSATALIQMDCWALDVYQAVAIKAAVENFLDALIQNPLDDSQFRLFFVAQEDERDLHYPPGDGSDRWTYRISVDYRLRYKIARS